MAAVDAALLRIGKAPKSFPRWAGTEKAPTVIRKALVERFPYVIAFEERKRHVSSWRSHIRNGVPYTGSHERTNNPAN